MGKHQEDKERMRQELNPQKGMMSPSTQNLKALGCESSFYMLFNFLIYIQCVTRLTLRYLIYTQ